MKKNLVFLLFLSSFLIYPQETVSTKKDLKVGLVLSGGGAKGFAHIAVLKVLEEAGVRVDYISGTSIGAIIGSLYASGYSARQLDSLIKNINFEKIIQDDIPRKSKPFYEKQSGEKYALVLPVSNKKIELPIALSKGQNVLNLLTELLHHVDTISNFNNLPIPFLCVATDIETGEKVILNNGFLPRAVQASGAFPTLLTPVEIDNRLLVDGGIVDNFPVDEIEKMHPDIIIGINLGNEYDKKEYLNSALKIINQIVSFQIYANYEEQIAKTDLHIHPDMTGYGVTSFNNYDEIYEIGEKAAREQFESLQKIAAQQSTIRPAIKIKPHANQIHIKSIEIVGNQNYTKRYIKGKMQIDIGESISHSEFLQGINNLSATGNFSKIQYQILDDNYGKSIIKLKLTQDPDFTHIKLAAHYDNLYRSAVLVNLTTKHLLAKNDITSADLILGDNIRYNFDYYIDNGSNWSTGFNSRYNTFKTDITLDWIEDDINKIELKYRDFSNTLYFQTIFNRSYALGIGIEHKNIRAYTETFTSTNSNEEGRNFFDKSNYYNFISYLKFDTYDKKYFQKYGLHLDVNFRWYLFSNDYNNNFNSFSQLFGEFGYAHTFFDKLTFHFITQAGIKIGNNDNDVLDFHLGGLGDNFINTFIPFYGYKFGSLSGEGYLLSTLKGRFKLFKNHYFLWAASAARVEKDLFNEGMLFENIKLGFGLGYGIDSFVGPVELNLTYSPDTNENYWFFNLGYWF
mgnify:CR=1 FL=1|tara:strand:+ start:3709 stop:5925 length:2217 start_codon:yes stop_codon:yes gene_type:complete